MLHHSHIIKGLTKPLTVMWAPNFFKFDLIAECTVNIAIIAITFAMLDLFELPVAMGAEIIIIFETIIKTFTTT